MIISIGMIVKNEEKNLERCLSSLGPLMKAVPSELIVVDTGSTDETVDIARKYTDKVYLHPWENDYAKMRNFTVNYSRGDWFFFIDADEELVEYEAMIEFLSGNQSRKYHAASVNVRSFYQTGDKSRFSIASIARLFRRTKNFRFIGAIHEQAVFDPPVFPLNVLLDHHGYVTDDPELKEKKLKLYVPILTQALEKEPSNVYLWYQLSRTYLSYQDEKAALEPAVKSYEIMKNQRLKPADHLYIYTNLAYLYLMNHNLELAEAVAGEGLKIKEWVPDLWFYMAKAQAVGKKPEEAIQSYKKFISYADHYDEYAVTDQKIVNYTVTNIEEAYLDMSILYRQTGLLAEALESLRKIESVELLKNSVLHIIDLLSDLKEYDFMRNIYNGLTAQNKEETWNSRLLELALMAEACDEKTYVRKLRTALQEYPEMKTGVEILLKKITDNMPPAASAVSSEMEAYAKIVKTNIKQMIDQGMLKEAGELIRGFEQIIPDDPEIRQLKAVIESKI